jgi:hypothetical protein
MLIWARAFICAQQNGYRMLAPQWIQPRFGAVIRGDPVKRFYFGEFTNNGYVGGLAKLVILVRAKRIAESCIENVGRTDIGEADSILVIEFNGLRDYFAGLIPFRDLIFLELKRIAHPLAVSRAANYDTPFIGVHVRRGDTTRQKIAPSEILQVTPTEWFVAAIDATHKDARWRNLPIKVVSDGSRDELKDVLRLPGCELVTTKKALGDILFLARASLLLASGYSTFSMWASFLGQMPTLYHPGRMQQKLFPAGLNVFEGEWRPGEPLPEFAF